MRLQFVTAEPHAIGRLHDACSNEPTHKHCLPNCCNSMQATLKDLQTTLKVAKSKEAASLPKEAKQTAVPAALDLESGVNADEHQALMQQQQQQQERLVLESRLQYNDALIDERDEGIQDIQRNIQDIQEMFQVCSSSVQNTCLRLLQDSLTKQQN